jgi:DNA adenine methylase
VVYLDPPYVPMSSTSNFSKYTSEGFDLDDQHRLAALVKILIGRGCTVIISNSDTETTRALYEGMTILSVQAKRHINSKGDQRGPVGEVIAVHYGPGHGPPKPLHEIMAEMDEEPNEEVSASPL